MKTYTLFLLFLIFGLNCNAQNFQLQITGNSTFENKTIDSLNYSKTHKNAKSISDEITITSEKLSKTGFIESQLLENKKTNDSSYTAKFSLGERVKFIHIYIGKNSAIKDIIALDKNKDSITIPYDEIESFLNGTLIKLEKKGFALAKLKLINIHKQNQIDKEDNISKNIYFEPTFHDIREQNQLEQQMRLSIESIKERQEWELINNRHFGLLESGD